MPQRRSSSSTEVNPVPSMEVDVAKESGNLPISITEVQSEHLNKNNSEQPTNASATDVVEVEVVETSPLIIISRDEGKPTEEDSDSPSESLESKRSLEALFQAAHSELQNMTAREEPSKGEELSSLLDKSASIPILIQMSHGTEVQGNLVKVVDDSGKVQLRIKTTDVAVPSPAPPQVPSPKPVGRKRKHPQKPGKHICPYCGVGCAKPSVLEKHVRAHTGERPYPCIPCGFSFKTKSNLYKHCKSQSHSFKLAMIKRGIPATEMDDACLDEGEEDEAQTSSMSIDSEVAADDAILTLASIGPTEMAESSPLPSLPPLPAPPSHKKMLVRANAVDEVSHNPLQRQMTPEERISWLISNNAAIVDTPMADPPRPKRMSRQGSEVDPSANTQLMPLNGFVLSEDIMSANSVAAAPVPPMSPQPTSSPQVYFLGLEEPSDQPPGQENVVIMNPQEASPQDELELHKKSLPSEIRIKFKLPKEGVEPQSSDAAPPPELLAPSVVEEEISCKEEESMPAKSDLVIIVHKDGSKEKVLVTRESAEGDIKEESIEMKKPQRGRPKGSRNKAKLKLNIPPTLIQPSTESPSVQPESDPSSAVPSWKLKLKGRLLLKRSISMEKGTHLSLEETSSSSPVATLKRAHSLGYDSSVKKKMLLDISQPIADAESPPPLMVLEPVVKSAMTVFHQTDLKCTGSCLQQEDDNALPTTLTIPLNLARNIPGLVEEAVPDESSQDENVELREDVIEHKAVQLCAESDVMRQKALMTLMLLGHSFPQMAARPCHTFFCSVLKPQPMYVVQDSSQSVSMYSNWRAALYNPHIMGLSTKEVLSLYQSHRYSNDTICTQASSSSSKTKGGILTHSSFWSSKHSKDYNEAPMINSGLLKIPDLAVASELKVIPSVTSTSDLFFSRKKLRQILEGKALQPSRVKIFPGGFKSLENYTYVRGRGRGMYVCEECGIRCKKPSMLKKHLRTHTEFRPYKCEFCEFKFKTKGNLTKHMKSKSHFRRCSEMGLQILTADDIDSPLNAHSEVVISQDGQFSDADDDDDDLDEEDEEEECKEEEVEEECKVEELMPKPSDNVIRITVNGDTILTVEKGKLGVQNTSDDSPRASIDKEIAASLLDLSKGTESEATEPKDTGRLSNVVASKSSTIAVTTPTSKSSFVLPAMETISSAPSITRAGFFPPVVSVSSAHDLDFVTIFTGSESMRIPVRTGKSLPAVPNSNEMTPLPGKVPDSQPQKSGKYTCDVCSKQFVKQHELSMHSQVHSFECRFKCSECQLSFRSQETLDKHLRCEAHQNKVQLNRHFGATDQDDPRPFKCRDCDVAFRAHGFLARHLRSHQHILQLEGCGKLPRGTASQLQDEDLKELDTLDSASNLQSILQLLQAAAASQPPAAVVEEQVVIEDGEVEAGEVVYPKEQYVMLEEGQRLVQCEVRTDDS